MWLFLYQGYASKTKSRWPSGTETESETKVTCAALIFLPARAGSKANKQVTRVFVLERYVEQRVTKCGGGGDAHRHFPALIR